jgi:GNAT superfamily N-acetyltransferase
VVIGTVALSRVISKDQVDQKGKEQALEIRIHQDSATIFEFSAASRMARIDVTNTYTIRDASTKDIPPLCAIGNAAVTKFGSIPELAHLVGTGEDTAMSKKIKQSLDRGRIFVAEHEGQAIGFLGTFDMDSTIYIAEISVHPDFNGKGVGGMLMEAVFAWARKRALEKGDAVARVSLTTYVEVSWNGPWYQRKGFREVDAASIGPEHAEKMRYDREERGLVKPGYNRCCMLWEQAVDSA